MKREVNMCDKDGCDQLSAGQCALCDQDVCVPKHARGTAINVGTHVINLHFLMCAQCTRGVDLKGAALSKSLQPFIELLRAHLAHRALGGAQDFIGGGGLTGEPVRTMSPQEQFEMARMRARSGMPGQITDEELVKLVRAPKDGSL